MRLGTLQRAGYRLSVFQPIQPPQACQSAKSYLMQVGGLQYEMTGFHGKRSEFDHEYDNDAELLISELDFPPTDSQV